MGRGSALHHSRKESAGLKPLLSTSVEDAEPSKNRKESAGLKPLLSTSVEDTEPSTDKTTSLETTQPAKKKSKSKSKNKTSEPSMQDIAYCPVSDTL